LGALIGGMNYDEIEREYGIEEDGILDVKELENAVTIVELGRYRMRRYEGRV